MSTSLEKLVNNLEESQLSILKNHFPNHLQLLARKGVYPYDYFSSFEKFEEKELPPPEAFYNTLTDEAVRPEDYQHAQNVWRTFNLKNLGEYHDLYLKTDVLLLTDVFENYRTLCLTNYEIDSAHVLTSPGLSWQACLKKLNAPLQLLTDVDMLLFFEKGIRGGVSVISQRYAEANTPYMNEDYNPNIPTSYIMYWDANNLYGYNMSEYLPCAEFEWIIPENIDEAFISRLEDDADYGYVFEVDIDYPAQLHELHNEYPVAPEKCPCSHRRHAIILCKKFNER